MRRKPLRRVRRNLTPMLTLHLFGIDHSRAPLAVREELAFSETELAELLPLFLTQHRPDESSGKVREVMLLSTCNRTEVYLVLEGEIAFYPLEPLRLYRPHARAMEDVCLRYHRTGPEVASHLFAVAAALRSEVPGDTQIARQVGAAANIARSAGVLGPLLEQLVAAALRTAKRVRRETGLAAGHAGTGPTVLRTIRRFHSLHRDRPVRVLLLGAGNMAEDVASHLVRSGRISGFGGRNGLHCPDRPASLTIAGVWARDRQKSVAFAARIGTNPLRSHEAEASLLSVDAVVGACRGRVALLSGPVLGPILEKRTQPLLVVDLGVPRNLDPILAPRDGIHAIFLDQLHQQMKELSRIRRDSLELAEAIVAEESARYLHWWRQWPLRPIRADIYASVEAVLNRWREEHPGPIRQLRIALHRNLGVAFTSLPAARKTKLVMG